jgi:hypothetical protein
MTTLRTTVIIIATAASGAMLSPSATADETKVPSSADWKKAKPVKLARELPAQCTAMQIRDWMRIRCECDLPTGGSFLSGDHKNVYFYADKPLTKWGGPDWDEPGFVEVIFAVRKNDRRIMQLTQGTHAGGYGGPGGQKVLMLISEVWLPDQQAPVITFTYQK